LEFENYLRITFFIPTLNACVAGIKDRKNGTLGRTLTAGATKIDVLTAFWLTEGSVIAIQALISYFVSTIIFQWNIVGSHFAFIFMLFLTGLTGLSASKTATVIKIRHYYL
jgi:hypothetical protein